MPQKHVLLVDDSKSARFALRALLQKQGFSVDTAETAEIALDMLGDSKPDAIFMDHMMPGMDGFTATRAIKRDPATAHIPVVMCTSNDREEHVQEARRLGTVGILPKPPTTEKLAEILDALDREMERAAGATESGESDGSSQPQAIETALQDILPNILADTLEPVLQEKLRSHSQTMKSEVMAAVLAQQAEREQALLQQCPGTIPADWREAVLRDALHQSDTRANERHTRLSNNLDDRLAAASGNLRAELQGEIASLASRLSSDRGLVASLQTAVAGDIEARAAALSRTQAESTAKHTAEEITSAALSQSQLAFAAQTAALHRKFNWLATGALSALAGMLAALYFL